VLDRQRYERQLRVVWAVSAASAVGAVFAPGAPTGLVVADVIWRAVFAGSVTLCAAFADRWSWVVLTGAAAAAVVGGDPAVVAVGLIALVVAVFASARQRRGPIVGTVAVALGCQVLLRLPSFGFTGATALITVAAVAPLLASTLLRVGTPVRRRILRIATWSAIGLAVALVPVALGAWIGVRESGTAVAESRAWLDAARVADQPAVVAHLEATQHSFSRVETATGGWWLWPARVLPWIGPQLHAVNEVASNGTDIAESAIAAAHVATVEDLRLRAGQIDVERLDALRAPLGATAAELEETKQRLADLDTTWLLPMLRSRVDDFERQVVDTADDTELAAAAVDVAPALLGLGGERTYAVLFGTPSESRELGGFVGNVGVLTADEGRVELERVDRAFDLNSRTQSLPLTRLADVAAHDFPARYLRYTPWLYWQNTTGTPDFPSVGEMVHELSPEGIGRAVDGVIYIDPEGLAGLLQLTGPVVIEGLAEPIGADNVSRFLLKDQYEQFPDSDARADFLERVARETFERVVDVDLPGPRSVGEALGDRARQGHLQVWSAHPDEQALFGRLGVTGALRPPSSGDELLVTISNANPNKADAYLERTLTYDADLDPTTGEVRGTITVDLENNTPRNGHPDVVGNDNGDPRGSNRTFLSLYTALDVRRASIDGVPLPLELQHEYGLQRAAAFVTLPPGGEARVTFEVGGVVSLDPDFSLRVRTPATASPDQVVVRVRVGGSPLPAPTLSGPVAFLATVPTGTETGTSGATVFELVGLADLRFGLPGEGT
jgi:hypothetical protein